MVVVSLTMISRLLGFLRDVFLFRAKYESDVVDFYVLTCSFTELMASLVSVNVITSFLTVYGLDARQRSDESTVRQVSFLVFVISLATSVVIGLPALEAFILSLCVFPAINGAFVVALHARRGHPVSACLYNITINVFFIIAVFYAQQTFVLISIVIAGYSLRYVIFSKCLPRQGREPEKINHKINIGKLSSLLFIMLVLGSNVAMRMIDRLAFYKFFPDTSLGEYYFVDKLIYFPLGIMSLILILFIAKKGADRTKETAFKLIFLSLLGGGATLAFLFFLFLVADDALVFVFHKEVLEIHVQMLIGLSGYIVCFLPAVSLFKFLVNFRVRRLALQGVFLLFFAKSVTLYLAVLLQNFILALYGTSFSLVVTFAFVIVSLKRRKYRVPY